MKDLSGIQVRLSQPQLDVSRKAENLKGAEGQFGNHQVKASSGWGLFGRVVLGVVTLGISELVRWAIRKGDAPQDANKASQVLLAKKDISQSQQKSEISLKQGPQWQGPLPHEAKPVYEITKNDIKDAYNVKLLELGAIQEYTAPDGPFSFNPINTYLRSEKPDAANSMTQALNNNIDRMKTGLEKMPDFKGTVYRGTNLSKEDVDKYVIGKEDISEPAFTSTSRSEGVASKYSKGNHIAVIFEIASKHGKSVETISQFKEEQEVIFKPGTQFKVTSRIQSSDGSMRIGLEEIGKK